MANELPSRRFIETIRPQRDALYAQALAAAGQAAPAEVLLQRAMRSAYRSYSRREAPADTAPWLAEVLRGSLPADAAQPAADGTTAPAMPAAAWARLAAAVQIEAAQLAGAGSDEALMAYDPELAPRKTVAAPDEPADGWNWSPLSRFVLAVILVLVVGIAVTVAISTEHRAALRPLPAKPHRPIPAAAHATSGAGKPAVAGPPHG